MRRAEPNESLAPTCTLDDRLAEVDANKRDNDGPFVATLFLDLPAILVASRRARAAGVRDDDRSIGAADDLDREL